MKTAQEWVKCLNLTPHIEGGYFKEVLKSEIMLEGEDYQRALYTSIYFLLEDDNCSNFHRLIADEVWYYHDGFPLTIHMIYPDGSYHEVNLGLDIEKGCVLQYCVPKGVIFGSSVKEGYALVSCMVSPGFDYCDFQLFDRQQLCQQYPQYKDIITKLTRK